MDGIGYTTPAQFFHKEETLQTVIIIIEREGDLVFVKKDESEFSERECVKIVLNGNILMLENYQVTLMISDMMNPPVPIEEMYFTLTRQTSLFF